MKEQASADAGQSGKSIDYRRKRINKIKSFIVVIVIMCLIMPSIFCVILEIQVIRLQNQMEELVNLHSEYGLKYDGNGNVDYAYAAEKPADTESSSKEDSLAGGDLEQNTQSDADLVGIGLTDEVQTEEGTKENNLNPDMINTTDDPDNALPGDETSDSVSDHTSASKNEKQSDGIYTGKMVYLTFDDGPSVYTNEILDILADYNVKATFFVIGKTDDESKAIYKRIVAEGHTLGMHSFSHKYDKVYNSVKDFDRDFTKLWKLLYDTTGYKPSIYRFPGGSDNLVNSNGMEKFIRYLNDKSIVYFDWNVVSGDATGTVYTKDQLIDNVLGGVALKKTSIVLMHDSQTKKTTVDSLPGLLDELTQGGAQILPLDKDVSPIQMIKADSVK